MIFPDPSEMTDPQKIERIVHLEETIAWFTSTAHMNYHKPKTGLTDWQACDKPLCAHARKSLEGK